MKNILIILIFVCYGFAQQFVSSYQSIIYCDLYENCMAKDIPESYNKHIVYNKGGNPGFIYLVGAEQGVTPIGTLKVDTTQNGSVLSSNEYIDDRGNFYSIMLWSDGILIMDKDTSVTDSSKFTIFVSCSIDKICDCYNAKSLGCEK